MSALVSSQNANQPLATSSSSLTADNVQKFRPYFKAFTSRFVQSIVQARMGINISHQCEPVTEQSEWFNVFTDEVGEVSAEVRRNLKQSLPDIHAVNLDILLRTVDGDELQLEAWRLAIDTNDIPPEKVDVKSHFYHNLSTALKSVICAARCTPTYRRYVFSQGEDSYILCYRLYTGENISTLGEDAISLSLATLPSPVGRFMIDLRYRTKMEIERPPPTPPQYTGRTRAFSERLPSEPNLNSFDRNDQRRHSAREGLQVPCSARQMPSIHSQPVLTTMATSPPSESPAVYASSPNYSDVVGAFSTSPVSEYGDAQTDLDPSISRSRRSSRKSSDGEESDKERKKVQIQKFPFSNLLDRTSPAKTRLSQSALITQVSRLKSDKPSASCVSMTIEEEEEDSGRTTPKAEKSPMTEEEMMALPPLLQSFLAPQYFDFTSGDDSIPESEDSYVRVPFFGSASEPVADEQSTNGGLAATVDLFQYRAEKELSAIFEVENRSALDFQALIKGYAAEKDKFDQFVGSVQVDEDSD
ncbi:hypothetical protein QR680_004710 [Steinernema hermaphroditum]|uniref:Autophagy-related protein 13 n=1 Tax=Steinernema hermaphroditum TaxID=289476 RepID=A0AA39HPK5_9BILA|nr:hypothetical protein QR680_004710 [Steinernema hermaphroditum]